MLDGVDAAAVSARPRRRRQDGRAGAGVDLPEPLVIDKIDAPYPDAVPNKEFDLVSGDHLVHVTITVVRQCTDQLSSLVCSPM